MKGAIVNAFLREILTFIGATDTDDATRQGITVLLKSNYKKADMPTYAMPLVIVEITPGSDSMQMLGGFTMKCWIIDISFYNHVVNTNGYDTTPYSSDLLSGVDDIRVLFSNFSIFKSPEMLSALNVYGMKITYEGDYKAEHLEHPDGLCIGERIRFDTVAWDDRTLGTGSGVLGAVVQTPIDNG